MAHDTVQCSDADIVGSGSAKLDCFTGRRATPILGFLAIAPWEKDRRNKRWSASYTGLKASLTLGVNIIFRILEILGVDLPLQATGITLRKGPQK